MLGQAAFVCGTDGCDRSLQGQHYRSFELAKNRDPEKEGSSAFLSAFAVHPVSEATLMYRLHKRFSALELERAYSEIEQLQVSGEPRGREGECSRCPGFKEADS